MQIIESLELLGLSTREARVYQALLNSGPTTITRIIKGTGIPSSKIYDILTRLEQKGLVSSILVKGKKEFHASNPKKLFDIIKEKESLIKDILPKLDELYNKTSEEVQAEIYKGKEGLKYILEDVIKEGKPLLNLGSSGKGEAVLPYYVYKFYDKLKEKNIQYKLLVVDSDFTREQFAKLKKYLNIKIKYLPKSIHNLMSVLIYADKVVIIPITPLLESMPILIMIKNKESADSYRELFEWLWKI